MKLARFCTSLFACCIPFTTVRANTEKANLLAPGSQDLPQSIAALHLAILTSSKPSLRKAVPVSFPSPSAGRRQEGEESWYLLADLNPQQRYEVRICWAANQPTKFDLDIFDATSILENQHLLQRIIHFSRHQASADQAADRVSSKTTSVLFLRIISTADFYTVNQTLMREPPAVNVDIILDPHLANIFPTSLLPTAGYIVLLAVASWYVSGLAWSMLAPNTEAEKKHSD